MTRILGINTGGIDSQDALRMRRLTQGIDARFTYVDIDKAQPRRESMKQVWRVLKSDRWDLVYQEGSGIAGGLNLIRAARSWKQPYVVSSGDPIGGFFRTTRGPLHGRFFETYERYLYSHAAGYIGWTPYLVGMAMKMGAKRAVTVEGAVEMEVFKRAGADEKRALKRQYGLDPDHIVCGVVGSLKWTPRQHYCYGLEIVEMLKYLTRRDVSVLIVGDGDGRDTLVSRIPEDWRGNVVLTGRVPEQEVVKAMNAMDIGFITQTLDGLGRYRLTTKLPEYLACALPIAMSPIPGFYDYAAPAGWPLPSLHPASDAFHRECASWIDGLSREEIRQRADRAPEIATKYFDYETVRHKFQIFIAEVLAASRHEASTASRGR